MGFELFARLRGLRGWDKVIARNIWFQGKACAYLARNAEKLGENAERLKSKTLKREPIVFSYSYAGRDIFRFAKQQGWKTVLGQIDPGPVEEEIVRVEHEAHPEFRADWEPAPPEYWGNWRKECELADHIMVNSEWSRTCLAEAGVNGSKLAVIPLAYEMPEVRGPATAGKLRSEVRREWQYPDRFDQQRPLRVLFLGQINLRKGAARLLEAAAALRNEPVEFWMVGPVQCQPPDHLRNLSNVRWFGRVARAEAQKYYSEADVFLLPTLSDGFALTQLEAQAHGLPVIASRCCGEVVKHGMNGLLIDAPTSGAIVEALRFCLANPGQLAAFSAASRVEDRFSIDALGASLLSLVNAR
jgi:glycosyltransferase involved in cell wall biosynthesis